MHSANSTPSERFSQRRQIVFWAIFVLSTFFAFALPPPAAVSNDVLFSPRGGIEERILRSINLSRHSIDVAVFSLTSGEIAQALAAAHKRSVRVRVLLDLGQTEDSNSEFAYLVKAGVRVRLLSGRPPRGVMHHKFAIFDGNEVVTGSYNWTHSAERYNRENVVFLTNPTVCAGFQEQFEKLWTAGQGKREEAGIRRNLGIP